jgi:prepilin-type N-terminal cleavage/methylation domain-containing protein
MFKRSHCGFTLIELIIVIALIGLLVLLAIPFYQSLQLKADLNQVGEKLASDLRRQQTYATSGKGVSAWGVRFNADSYTLFKGISFSLRDPAVDEIVNLPSSVRLFFPMSEVVFGTPLGNASVSGQLILTNLVNNQTLTVDIFSQGLVQLN